MKGNRKRFGLVGILLAVIVIGLVIALVWIYIAKQQAEEAVNMANEQQTAQKNKEPNPEENKKLDSHTINNEGLTFEYNPQLSTVVESPAVESELNGTYLVYTMITTGDVVLKITAGISGIGGLPTCQVDGRETCEVIDTKASTYLGDPITYRLVKANLVTNCGSPGSLPCDTVPLTTSYIIDTSTSTEYFGSCCGTISSNAKNLEKKAKNAGSLLINIQPADEISNESLFTNPDFLKTIKIIETMRYKDN